MDLFCISEFLRCVFGEVRSQKLFRFRERQMKVIQSIHANAKILAAAFKKMTSLRAVFGKKMEVIPCDIECA